MKPPKLSELLTRCDAWNKAHPVGTEVEFHPIIGKPDHRVTRTRTEAYVMSAHTAVVFVEGVAGCVALDACIPTRRTI
jgi:hypothetical protein